MVVKPPAQYTQLAHGKARTCALSSPHTSLEP